MFLGCEPPETDELVQELSDEPRYLLDSYLASASAALPGMFGISTAHGPGYGSSMLVGTMSLAALLQQKNGMVSPWPCSTPQSQDSEMGAADTGWNMLHQATAPCAPTPPWTLLQRGACGPAAAALALGAPTSLLLQPHPIPTQPVSDRLHPNLNETGAPHAKVNVNRLARNVSQLSMHAHELTPTSCSSRSQTATTVDESDPSLLMPAGPCHPGWGMGGAGVHSISSEEIREKEQLHIEQNMHFYPAQVHPVLPHMGHSHHPASVLHPDPAQCGDHYHNHRSSPTLHTQRPLLPCSSSSSAAVGAGAVCGSSSAHCLPSLPTIAPAACPTSGESDPLFEQRSEPQMASDAGPDAVLCLSLGHSVPTHIVHPQPWPQDPRHTLYLHPGLNPTHDKEWASSAPVPPAHLLPHPNAPHMGPLLSHYESHLAPQFPPPHTPQRAQRGRGRISARPQRRRLRHQIIDAEVMLEQLQWEAAVAEEQNRGLRAWVLALEDVVVCRTEELARLELVVRGPAALAAPTATPPTGITKRTETISTSPKADPYDTQLGEANTLKDMSASKEDGRRGGGRGSWLGRKAKSAPAVISGSRKAGKLQHGGGGGCGRSDDGHMSMSPRAAALQPAWDAIDHASLEAVAAELAGPEAVKVSVDAGVAGVVALFGSLERAACASAEDVASVYGSVAQQWGAEVMAGGADGDGAATLCRAQGRRNVHVSSAGGTRRGHKAQHTSNDAAHSSAAATAPTGRDACMSLLAALPMLHALNPGALSVMGCSLVPGALVDVHTHWHEVSLLLGLSQAQALKLGMVYQAMCSHKQQEQDEERAALAAALAAWDREAQEMAGNGPRGFLCRTPSDIVRASQIDHGCARLAASDWRALALVVDVSVRVLTQQQAARLVALSYPLAPDFVGLAHAVWVATGGAQQVSPLHS